MKSRFKNFVILIVNTPINFMFQMLLSKRPPYGYLYLRFLTKSFTDPKGLLSTYSSQLLKSLVRVSKRDCFNLPFKSNGKSFEGSYKILLVN